MIFFQRDEDSGIWNCIADGYLVGKFKTEKTKDIVKTSFTLCYNIGLSKTGEKKYYSVEAVVYGEENARFIVSAKRNKTRLVILGNSQVIPDAKQMQSKYFVRATALIPIGDIVKLSNYYNGSMRYDKNIIEAYETRYDYTEPEKESEHMI